MRQFGNDRIIIDEFDVVVFVNVEDEPVAQVEVRAATAAHENGLYM